MSIRESITRQSLIINMLRKRPASLREIEDYLAREAEVQGYKLVVSPKTFKRDIDEIFTLYKIEIKYDFSEKTYSIIDDNQSQIKGRLLEAFDTFNALNIAEGISKYVHFENRKPKGTENLYGLLHAIKNTLKITFTFQDFWEDKPRTCIVEPFALKEFKNRWYILAKDLADNKTKRFALDRLADLEITKKHFESKKEYNVEEIYRNCFGIITPDEKEPSEVELLFDAYQGKYIQSLPLHESQQVVFHTPEKLQISLRVFITHDFIMELLSYGETVTVMKPEKLKTEIKRVLESALDNYA
jgi:predicted DNA-binding transcriptional regulator YafY